MTKVIIDRAFEYPLEDGTGRKRRLPAGWSGDLPAKVADKMKTAGAGRVVPRPAKPASGEGKGAEGGAGEG